MSDESKSEIIAALERLSAVGENDFLNMLESLGLSYLTDLKGSDLSGIDLSGTNLTNADLSDCMLSNTNLSRSCLRFVQLVRADLSKANLSWADLSGADLSGADLSGALLTEADLSGAQLAEAVLNGTDLAGARLPYGNLSKPAPPKNLLQDIAQMPPTRPAQDTRGGIIRLQYPNAQFERVWFGYKDFNPNLIQAIARGIDPFVDPSLTLFVKTGFRVIRRYGVGIKIYCSIAMTDTDFIIRTNPDELEGGLFSPPPVTHIPFARIQNIDVGRVYGGLPVVVVATRDFTLEVGPEYAGWKGILYLRDCEKLNAQMAHQMRSCLPHPLPPRNRRGGW